MAASRLLSGAADPLLAGPGRSEACCGRRPSVKQAQFQQFESLWAVLEERLSDPEMSLWTVADYVRQAREFLAKALVSLCDLSYCASAFPHAYARPEAM